MRHLLLPLLALLTTAACGAATPAPDPANAAPYPMRVVAPSTVPGEWALEQEVTITHAEGENSFRAVLQKRGDELMLMGVGPHGGRAFVLTQRGTEFEWETFVRIELPFPPEYMLYDVHRAWLVPTEAPEDGANEKTLERDGERIVETYRDGLLVQRTFERLDGAPEGLLTVDYPDGLRPDAPAQASPPPEMTFDNRWHGYRATVRTLNYTPLGAPVQGE